MGNSKVSPHAIFKVGVFWFVATDDNPSRLVSQRSTFDPNDCNVRLHYPPYGHAEAWPHIQRLDRSLSPFQFDHFPRGRLEFSPPGRRWKLFVDDHLTRDVFIDYLVAEWALPRGHLTVQIDPAYRKALAVADPES